MAVQGYHLLQLVQRGASSSPRELERLRREAEELRRDNQACLVALQLKDEVGWDQAGVGGLWCAWGYLHGSV